MLLETCPFNPSHIYKSTKKERHLLKCEALHANEGFVRCVFDSNHIVKEDQKIQHLKECDAIPADIIDFVLKRAEDSKWYELHRDEKTESSGFDSLIEREENVEPSIHTKVKHWLENNSDVISSPKEDEEEIDIPCINIACDQDKPLPSRSDPHECHDVEALGKVNGNKNKDIIKASGSDEKKYINQPICSTRTRFSLLQRKRPPPLRTASHFIQAKFEKGPSNDDTCESVASVESLNSSIFYPNRPGNKVSSKTTLNTLSSKYRTETPSVNPEDSVSNVGINDFADPVHYGTRSVNSLDVNSIESSVVSLMKEERPVGSRTPSLDMDYIKRKAVPLDLNTIISSNVTLMKEERPVGSRTPSLDMDYIKRKAVPLDLNSIISSNVTLMKEKKPVPPRTPFLDMDYIRRKSVPLDLNSIISSNVSLMTEGTAVNTRASSSIIDYWSKAVPLDLESMISSCAFLTAKDEAVKEKKRFLTARGLLEKIGNKGKMRSIAVQTEGLCECNASVH